MEPAGEVEEDEASIFDEVMMAEDELPEEEGADEIENLDDEDTAAQANEAESEIGTPEGD